MSQLSLINYQTHGDAANPKLVFLHGLMGFASNWRGIARHFESQYQILLYDQRGHGKSFQPATGYSTADYAADLIGLLDGLGWDKCTLIGHSMGGRVAVEAAYLYPERVEKLVIADIGPASDIQSMSSIEEKLNSVPVPFASRDEARLFFDSVFLQKYKSETLKQFFYANLEEKTPGCWNWKFSKQGILETLWKGRTLNQWKQFESLKMPTLLLRGERSQDLSAEMYAEVLKRNPHISGKVVADAGHWIHADQPQKVIAELQAFLS
ncbi:MAG: alpha/beta hydrolase [Bdellovibrionaceae bacterium]|nr:alpha/beta hydrolase [Pseudobdellovibrionaceae bacterium]